MPGSRPTVVAEFRGGLGNQLFQYAAAQAVAVHHGARAAFIHDRRSPPDQLARFLGVMPPAATDAESRAVGVVPGNAGPLSRAVIRLTRRAWRPNVVHQAPEDAGPFAAMPSGLSADRPLGLFGYFQHPSWYEPALPAMIDRMLAAAPPADAWHRPDVVAIHFRRGDYVRFGWDLPLSYYEAALERLAGGHSIELAVLADDAVFEEMVAEHYRRRGFTIHARRTDRVIDFWTLAGAGSVIMSNSTFCWWASVIGDALGPRMERRVMFPAGWVKGHGGDLRRSDWIPIPSDLA